MAREKDGAGQEENNLRSDKGGKKGGISYRHPRRFKIAEAARNAHLSAALAFFPHSAVSGEEKAAAGESQGASREAASP